MTEITAADVLLALVSIFNSLCQLSPEEHLDKVLSVVAPRVQLERHMSMEEIRLNRFWRDYYASMARWNEDLSKLDWTTYYKNHGKVVGDSSKRINFAPVVVVPRFEPAFPQDSALPPVSATTTPGTTNPPAPTSSAERRLEKFNYEYQAAGKRWQGRADQIDWAAFYLNHRGCQTTKGEMQYLQSVTPEGAKFAKVSDSNSSPDSADTPMSRLRRAPTSMSGSSSDQWPPIPVDLKSGRPFACNGCLQIKVFEVRPGNSASSETSWKSVTIDKDGHFCTYDTNNLALFTGTIKDLTPSKDSGILRAADFPTDNVSIGATARGKVTSLGQHRAKLDLTLERNDVESAGKENIVISGQTFRVSQQVSCGQPCRITLQSGPNGEPRMWLEVVVQEPNTGGQQP